MARYDVVNLDKIVAKIVHAPRVDDVPIYARVNNAIEDAGGTRTKKWENTVKTAYTSPDNVRRVFITYKGVYVHLYQPIKGISSKSLRVEKDYGADVNILSIAKCFQSLQAGVSSPYLLRGTGLSALVSPWVCSNIEEVYFDFTVLLSDDFSGKFDRKQLRIPTPDEIEWIFKLSCSDGAVEVQKRFPRLRVVGYAANLEEMYQSIDGKSGVDSIEDLKKPWCVNEQFKSELSKGKASIWKIPGTPNLITSYSLKPNIYCYDAEILQSYFEDLVSKIDKYKAEQAIKLREEKQGETDDTTSGKTGNKEQTRTSEKKGVFERMLDEIYARQGAEKTESCVKISIQGIPKIEIKAIYNGLTADGKQKYGKYLGV